MVRNKTFRWQCHKTKSYRAGWAPIKAENVACKSRNFSKLLCLKYSPNSIRTFPSGGRSIYLFPPLPPPGVRLTAPLPVNRAAAAARLGAAKRLVAWPQTISPGGVNSAPVCCHFICYVTHAATRHPRYGPPRTHMWPAPLCAHRRHAMPTVADKSCCCCL